MSAVPDLPDSSRLVFVAGLHRSGTTPLARVLSAHPDISGFHDTGVKEDEGQHLQEVYPSARSYGGAGRFARDERSHLTERSPLATPGNARLMLRSWMPHWDLDRRLLLEKSPPNLVMTRFLQKLYPDARFIVVVRHPVVVALSTRKWAGPLTGIGSLLEHWLRAHETFLADMAHLRNVQVIRYEDLVADPEGTLATVATFLGLSRPIDASLVDSTRSDGYRRSWEGVQASRGLLARAELARLRRRYARRVRAFGFDLDDLDYRGELAAPAPPLPDPPGPLRVLYVGGMPRSGSTLTDLMLHQLPGHFGVGELFYLWRNGLAHDGLCACGASFSDCSFWAEVGRRAFGGWDRTDPERVMALQERVDKTSRIPLLLSPWRPRGFADDLAEYTDILRRLYGAIAAVSGRSIVVDSSKRPSLAYVLRTMPDVDLRVVHVVRDPRGVAFSFAKHVALPPGAALKSEMPRSTTRKVSRRWVSVNALIGGLRRTGVPVTRVRYEDLVAAPERELRKVLDLMGEDATDTSFDHLQPAGVTIPVTHVVAGGRIRLASGTMALRLDEQWQRDMPDSSRRLVEVMTAPARSRYGYS